MKKMIFILVVAIFTASAYAQQLSITNTSVVIVPPSVSDTSRALIWASNTVYKVGSLMVGGRGSPYPYVAQFGGTSGTNGTVFTGTSPISDGTVTWVLCPGLRRNGFILNLISGGAAVISLNGGYLMMNAGNTTTFDNPYYQGAVIATSTSTNVFGVTVW